MALVTKEEIMYRTGSWGTGPVVRIPAGTEVEPADNLPEPKEPHDIAYWVKPWVGMSNAAKMHQRNYGFGLTKDQVTVI